MKSPKLLFDLESNIQSSSSQDPRFALDGKNALRFQGLNLGCTDFSISLDAECPDGDWHSGDIISQFDAATRTGFSLGITSLEASCTSRATVGKLSFGIDAQTDPVWVGVGNPGGTTVFPYGFCEYGGSLYAATCSGGAGGRGAVYRFESPNRWIDCGCPCVSNAVTALGTHDGILYAAASTYDTRGTHLAEAGNMTRDGHVYGFDGTAWQDYGEVTDCQVLAGLTVLGGDLYVTAFNMFTDAESNPEAGLYRMGKLGEWEFLGNPGERISPITARNGKIVAGGYNKGGIYAYDPKLGCWEEWGRPPYEDTTQIYSFVEFNGELLAGTWRSAKVFVIEGPHRFRDLGVLGNELEVMGMAVYNGKLYAGTLPLAQIYRYEGEQAWTLIDRLDHTETEYRRAWSMGLHGGRLFCGVVPSGQIYAMTAGQVATVDQELPKRGCRITVTRKGSDLTIYINGIVESRQSPLANWQKQAACELDISNNVQLSIGSGPGGSWQGKITNLKVVSYAMTQEEIAEEAAL